MFHFLSNILMGIGLFFSTTVVSPVTTAITHMTNSSGTAQVAITQDELSAMAGNSYANGILPLGDGKYSTTTPQKGTLYLCNVLTGGGGAQETGYWISGNSWNSNEKPSVQGAISWPTALFSNTINGTTRTLSGNGLPVGTTTGIFPISASDPAHQYDANPNSIHSHTFTLSLPVNPTYSDTPYCMGGEVGVMLNGVPLFNGFDAENRDAAAHEIQDSCDGHPQESDIYHYHSLSKCFSDISETTVLGFALDGFPITGPLVSEGKYLTTDNLDVCHGITSEINLDGKSVTMYHYVMTADFPYSVSCFRGKPVKMQVIEENGQNGQSTGRMPEVTPQGILQPRPSGNSGPAGGMRPMPPQAAFTACVGKSSEVRCSFMGQNGNTITGTCQGPLGNGELACLPPLPSGMMGRPNGAL